MIFNLTKNYQISTRLKLNNLILETVEETFRDNSDKWFKVG